MGTVLLSGNPWFVRVIAFFLFLTSWGAARNTLAGPLGSLTSVPPSPPTIHPLASHRTDPK